MMMYEVVSDFKSGRPLMDFDAIVRKAQSLNIQTGKNAISNLTYPKEARDKFKRFTEIRKIMQLRSYYNKQFFLKFDMMNPFKLYIGYGSSLLIKAK